MSFLTTIVGAGIGMSGAFVADRVVDGQLQSFFVGCACAILIMMLSD